MQTLTNEIVLRPRFQLKLEKSKQFALNAFESAEQPPFIIKKLEDHVFIKFDQRQIHFWSPQLHLEMSDENNGCIVSGLFGPNPTLWTFFMFLHFGVATIFVILGVWAYSSAALKKPYGLQIGLMIFMSILWFVLYTFGRYGRKKGKPQMKELYDFMTKKLEI